MDDGWCSTCQEITDGECVHFDDGTTEPRPAQEILRLRAEVAQLRKFQQSLHPTELDDYMKTYYVVNDREITSAWRHGCKMYSLGGSSYFDALEKLLGIVACSECCGDGVHTAWDFYPGETPGAGNTCSACDSCHGRGWIMT